MAETEKEVKVISIDGDQTWDMTLGEGIDILKHVQGLSRILAEVVKLNKADQKISLKLKVSISGALYLVDFAFYIGAIDQMEGGK